MRSWFFFSEHEVVNQVNRHVCFEPFCHGVNQMFREKNPREQLLFVETV